MLWGKINPVLCEGAWERGARLVVIILNGVTRLVLTEVTFVNRLETGKCTSGMKYGERI